MATILWLWSIFIISVQAHSNFIAYDCSQSNMKYKVLSMVPQNTCNQVQRVISNQTKLIQVLQRQEFSSVPFYSCAIKVEVNLFKCRGLFDTNLYYLQSYTTYQHVGRETCKDIVKEQRYFDPHIGQVRVYLKNNVGKLRLKLAGSITETSCSGGSFSSHIDNKYYTNAVADATYTVTVTQGHADVNLNTKRIHLPAGLSGAYENGKLSTEEGAHYYWAKVDDVNNCLENPYRVAFEGSAQKVSDTVNNVTKVTYALIDSALSRAFMISIKKEKIICGEKVFSTIHKNIFIKESEDGRTFRLKKEENVSLKDIQITTYVDLKGAAMYSSLMDNIRNLYDVFKNKLCETRFALHQQIINSALIQPNAIGQILYNRRGLLAVVRSEALFLLSCKNVTCRPREVEGCFEQLAVTCGEDKQELFLEPRTHILSKIGVPTSCSSVLSNLFNINDVWYSTIGSKLIPTTSPETFEQIDPDWQPQDDIEYAAMGLYSDEELKSANNIVTQSQNLRSNTLNLVNTFRPMNQDIQHDFNILETLNIKKLRTMLFGNFFDGIFEKLERLGNYTALLLGICLVFKVVIFVFNMLANFIILLYVHGLSFVLLFSWLDSVIHIFLNGDQIKKRREERKRRNKERKQSQEMIEMKKEPDQFKEEDTKSDTTIELLQVPHHHRV